MLPVLSTVENKGKISDMEQWYRLSMNAPSRPIACGAQLPIMTFNPISWHQITNLKQTDEKNEELNIH